MILRLIDLIGIVLCVGLLGSAPVLAANPIQAPSWNGEYLAKKQGAFYVKMRLNGFKSSKTKFITGDVKITISNILTKDVYSFSYPLRSLSSQIPYFKVRSGKYTLDTIELVGPDGKKRSWSPSDGKSLIVKRQYLSNFGLWSMRASGSTGLAVKLEMIPNSYKEQGSKRESRIAGVLNGFSGLVQEKLGGKAVVKNSKDDFSTKDQLRASYSFTRQIAMFYELNLYKHNYKAKEIAGVLSVYDNSLRSCYTDRLELNAALKGKVTFKFILSKSTGTLRKLKYVGGSARDPKLVKCMYLVLSQIQFSANETMLGELTYNFDVK